MIDTKTAREILAADTRSYWPRENIEVLLDELDAARAEVRRLREVPRRVFNVGHDDDCLLCGFKDRIASEALRSEGEYDGN
jgi:hypothetical protein